MSELSTQIEVVEFKISLSCGLVIAVKWWGPKDIRPIVLLHGWQDNAGTFDRLVPLLPKNFSYLAIDLPGHGYSSYLPSGHYYSNTHFVYLLNFLMDYFKWEKISLLGHSLGAISSFLFAALFGPKVDFIICLDAIVPFTFLPDKEVVKLQQSLTGCFVADKRNQEKIEPPSFRYDEIIDIYAREGYMSVNRDYASHIIDRGVRPSVKDPNRFYLTKDGRLKYIQPLCFSHASCLAMAQRISVPVCFIKTNGKLENMTNVSETIDVLHANNQLFECHSVDGNHFVHLNNPERISGFITEFLLKYHKEQKISKL